MIIKNKKIGLLGGSFNPIHNLHIKIVKQILDKKIVDEVWFIPCANHVFKKYLAPGKHRINMLRLSIQKYKDMKINLCEFNRKEKSYTIDTLKCLTKKYPNFRFYWIIGADILLEFEKWYKKDELLKNYNFLIIPRTTYRLNEKSTKMLEKFSGLMFLNSIWSANVSSTEIRNRIKAGKSVKKLIDPKIEKYIKKYGLYSQIS
jgi:nicotinate-nucleotide adenylyltransferase